MKVSVTGQASLSGAGPLGADSAILVDSTATGMSGNAGSITLTAGSLQVLGGAKLSSSTVGAGAGGNVTATVSGQATISGADGANNDSNIYAGTSGKGAAGNITLTANSLELSGGAELSQFLIRARQRRQRVGERFGPGDGLRRRCRQ